MFRIIVMGIVTWLFRGLELSRFGVLSRIYDFFWVYITRNAIQRLSEIPAITRLVQAIWAIIA